MQKLSTQTACLNAAPKKSQKHFQAYLLARPELGPMPEKIFGQMLTFTELIGYTGYEMNDETTKMKTLEKRSNRSGENPLDHLPPNIGQSMLAAGAFAPAQNRSKWSSVIESNKWSSNVEGCVMGFSECEIPKERAAVLCKVYRAALFDDLVPWWEAHSIDRACGGYYGCLERDGRVYATDKYMWLTGRQIWMLSHLYNRHKHREEWLDLARHGAHFLLEHGFAAGGKMHFRVTRDGAGMATCLSLYTECFAAIGLAELSKPSGDELLWDRAVDMVDLIFPRLGQPDDTPLLGYPINARFHLHAHDMIRMTVAWVCNEIQPADRWEAAITESIDSLLARHWKPELGALLENVAPDGEALLDLPEGRMMNPGHAIESAWMLMEAARKRKDASLMDSAIEITMKSLERGWDEEYGGLRYLMNLDRTPTHPLEADLKLWWPHGETLYALLQAWAYTGREDIGRWYEKVHAYTFDRFPDRECGEWFGYLNREGSPVFTAKANGWKGFFHVPRILFRGYQLLSGATGR